MDPNLEFMSVDGTSSSRSGPLTLKIPHRALHWCLLAVVTCCVVAAGVYVDHLNNLNARQIKRQEVFNQLGVIRAQLEGNVTSNIQAVQGLVALIATEPNLSQQRYAQIAAPLFSGSNQLRNIGAAPDMIIRYMYPLEGNEGALGLNLAVNEDQAEAAQRARGKGRLIVAGPVNLVQGGQGIIGRIPVYYGENGEKRFWGLISAVIDVETLYRDSGLLDPDLPLVIALRGKDGMGANGEIFHGTQSLFQKSPVVEEITLPNGSWQIAAVPVGGWPVRANNAVWVRSGIVGVVLLILVPIFAFANTSLRRQDEERRLRGLFELSPLGIALNDYKTGAFVDVNEALVKPSGFTREEFLKRNYWEISSDEYQGLQKKQLQDLKDTGRFGPYEKQYMRKDGTRYPVIVNGILIKDSKGRKYTWSIIEDISRRKIAEQALAEHQQQLQLVMDSTGVGIWDWNIATNDIKVNERWANMLGYKLEELSPLAMQGWRDLCHPVALEEVGGLLKKHWSGQSDYHTHEMKMRHKSGRWIWVLTTGKVIDRQSDGKPARMVGTHVDITPQKEVQEELKVSQQELKNFFDLSANLMCIANISGRFEKINQAFIGVLGYSEAEMLSQPFLALVHPDDLAATHKEIERLATGEKTISFTNRYRCRDGSFVSLLWNASPEPHSGKIYASAADITDEVRTKKILARQQIMLEQMSQQARIGAWEIDMVSLKLSWSSMTREIYEVDEEYVPGSNWGLNFYKEGESRDTAKAAIDECVDNGTPFDLELEIITAKGKEIWVRAMGRAEINHGVCTRLYGSLQDITGSKTSEDRLRAAHAELEQQMTLVEAIAYAQSNFIEHADLKTPFKVLLNDLLLLTKSQFGFVGEIIYNEDDVPFLKTHVISDVAWSSKMRQSYESSMAVGLEFRNLKSLLGESLTTLEPVIANKVERDPRSGGMPMGHPVIESYLGIPIKQEGKGIALVGLANRPEGFDRTVVYWLQPLMSTIGQIVQNIRAVRAREQAEKDLVKAKEAAEAAANIKSEFLATMSHEIRTPMNGVIGMLNLLKRSNLDDQQQRKLGIASESADSLLTLINDILDFSKVDAGKLDLETIDFDLLILLGSLAESLALRAQEKNIELVLDLTGIQHPGVKGDAGRLRQVFTNLIGNAIKFTHQGEVIIRCKTEASDIGVTVSASIIDSGIGIPESAQATLFQPFTQVDASTTRQYGGTGLGLAICKKLCETMGGEIGVTSVEGSGSSFNFSVNLEVGVAISQAPTQYHDAKIKLLVVDDNDTNRDVIRRQLEMWGVNVVTAACGSEALTVLADIEGIEAVLIDSNMPEMSGVELVNNLRAQERYTSLCLIVMADMNLGVDGDQCEALRIVKQFPKPATIGDLQSSLECIVGDADAELDKKSFDRPSLHKDKFPLRNNVRILLVEDNAVNVEVINLMLSDLGLLADVAGNGFEAIQALKTADADPYSLVLMDCQMPELDGYTASRKIRAGEAGQNNIAIPIIAMTANAMKGDKEKCLAAGMSDYISKPVNEDLLENKLCEWLPDRSDSAELKSNPRSELTSKSGVASVLTSENSEKQFSLNPALAEWDQSAALAMLKGRQERLQILLKMFCEHAPERLASLHQGVDEQDFDLIEQAAHSLKGSASQLKALQLQDQAEAMEFAAKKQNVEQVKTIYSAMSQCFDKTIDQFKDYISEYDARH